MSGNPTESELQTQWRNAVDLLEQTRAFADGSVVGGGNLLDVLLQSLEGEFTPAGITAWVQRYRASLAGMIESRRVSEMLSPILFEYGRLVDRGGGVTTLAGLKRALYEHFVANSLTVQSRSITFDTTATAGGTNVGNGVMSRLTVDEHGFPLESCYVETKQFRCRQDRNSGVREHEEVFDMLGVPQSPDGLGRASAGSGDVSRAVIRSRNAGSASDSGSLLRNSSFSLFSSTGTPKFQGWNEAAGGAQIAQDTTNFYRSFPNASVDASLKITGGGGTVTLKQPLEQIQGGRLNPDTPYFLRVMLNKTIGTAAGGTVTIRCGSEEASVTIAALGSDWQELLIPIGAACWFRNFNEAPFDIEIEWASSSGGFLLVDDVIFAPWTLIDGTYWLLRQNASSPIAWLVDDTLDFTDTGGAPATAKIQWWLWVAGLGYLPSTTGTPTFTDPV